MNLRDRGEFALEWFVRLAALFAVSLPAIAQQEFQDYRDVKLSDLLQTDVTTASKIAQPLLETPVAITVIDRAEIDSYGVQSIPELLRDVVGMNVMMYDSGDHIVAMRGSTFTTPTNNILVLIDGRNIYQNFYGFVLWDALPLSVDEIDRIEVIRGPASSLYGANAMMGVVNIITKKIDAEDGFAIAGGTPGVRYGSAQIASKIGRLRTRTNLSYYGIPSFSPLRSNAPVRVPTANISAQLPLLNNRSLTFTAAMTKFDGQLQVSDFAYAPLHENLFGQASATYATTSMTLRTYWNRTRLRSQLELARIMSLIPFRVNEDVLTTEYQQNMTHSIGSVTSRLVWGAEVQQNSVDATFIERKRSQVIFSGFGQDELHLRPNLILMAGLRFDRHPVTGNHYSPRGSLTYLVRTKHAFRFAYGSAYRNPSVLETFGCIRFAPPCSTASPTLLLFAGKPTLAAESIRNYEVGYRGSVSSRLSAGVTYYTYRDTDRPAADALKGSIFRGVTAHNLGGTRSSGIETEADAVLTNSLRLRANYRIIGNSAPCALTATFPQTIVPPAACSGSNVYRHTANTDFDFRWPGGIDLNLRANGYFHRIDALQYPGEQSSLQLFHIHASYTRPIGTHEWSPFITILNATNRRAAEIVDPPSDNGAPAPMGSLNVRGIGLRRTITVGMHLGL